MLHATTFSKITMDGRYINSLNSATVSCGCVHWKPISLDILSGGFYNRRCARMLMTTKRRRGFSNIQGSTMDPRRRRIPVCQQKSRKSPLNLQRKERLSIERLSPKSKPFVILVPAKPSGAESRPPQNSSSPPPSVYWPAPKKRRPLFIGALHGRPSPSAGPRSPAYRRVPRGRVCGAGRPLRFRETTKATNAGPSGRSGGSTARPAPQRQRNRLMTELSGTLC